MEQLEGNDQGKSPFFCAECGVMVIMGPVFPCWLTPSLSQISAAEKRDCQWCAARECQLADMGQTAGEFEDDQSRDSQLVSIAAPLDMEGNGPVKQSGVGGGKVRSGRKGASKGAEIWKLGSFPRAVERDWS